jgi:hypothetical protein
MRSILAATRTNSTALALFAALQALDVATTLYGFSVGANETNGFLRLFFPVFGPLFGLLVGKLLASGLVFVFLTTRGNSPRMIRIANIYFSALVLWNVVIIGLQVSGWV